MHDAIICLPFSLQESISGVGFLHQLSVRDTYPCHTHEFYELFYVLKGKAIHHINGTRTVLSQGTLVFIRPSDVHHYSFLNHYDMELLSIGIKPELFDAACGYLGLEPKDFTSPQIPLQCTYTGSAHWHMAEKLQQIGREEPGNERRKYFQSILPDLLLQLLRSDQSADAILPPWLFRLLDEMSKPENFIEGLPRMLELSGVSQGHLARSFKRYLGMTATAFINLKRISYSAELLLQNRESITDICFHCGFNHVGYFYEVFESVFHCTPTQFVKTHTNIR